MVGVWKVVVKVGSRENSEEVIEINNGWGFWYGI